MSVPGARGGADGREWAAGGARASSASKRGHRALAVPAAGAAVTFESRSARSMRASPRSVHAIG